MEGRTRTEWAAEYCMLFGREQILQPALVVGEKEFLVSFANALGIEAKEADEILRGILYPGRFPGLPDIKDLK